jgi:starch synthase
MNVLFVSAEAAPFAKVGGLGDVVAAGSLPTALRRLNIDARVIMPMYGTISRERFNIEFLFDFVLPIRTGDAYIKVYRTIRGDVPFYFIESWPFFGDEHSVYTEWSWDVPRFIFFNQAAMAVAWELGQREGWFPNLFHVNDWHTGLIPFFIKDSAHRAEWADVRSMMTIHNMAYQGEYISNWVMKLGIPARNHPALQMGGLGDNMLAIGIAYSDFMTTVSPRHAEEIQYPYMGYSLYQLVRSRTYENRLYGVLNGIDTEKFDPATDPHLVANYDSNDFADARAENKQRLQAYAGLEERTDIPLLGIVSRLVWQKGIDIAIPAIRRLLGERDAQFIALGTGDPHLSRELWRIAQDFPTKARIYIQYDPAVAQRIYAGSDMFVMPSRYEPCGIGQMLAMRYGSLPIVRETGGLADTVENYDNGDGDVGTGFTFQWEEPDALLNTLRWALDTYTTNPVAWRAMQQRAMQQDFTWERSAVIYRDLYRKVIER